MAECAEFTETFQALHPEMQPGNQILDLFPDRIVRHLAPKMSDDRYGDYVKQLDSALVAARRDVDAVHISSDASAPVKSPYLGIPVDPLESVEIPLDPLSEGSRGSR